MKRSQDRRALRAEIRVAADVLRSEWDPIGGGEMADLPADEYDAYAPHVVAMLQRGAPDASIAAYLGILESEVIGLPSGRDLVTVARKLRAAVAAAHHRAP